MSSQAIDDHKNTFDREMLLKGKNLSEEEFERLMKKHNEELTKLEQNFEGEKLRQKKALEATVRHYSVSQNLDQYRITSSDWSHSSQSGATYDLLLLIMAD